MGHAVHELLKRASDAAFAIDKQRRIVAWNAQAEKLLGYPADAVVGLSCGEVLRATLPGCEALCHPDCAAFRSLSRYRPCSIPACLLPHQDGHLVTASIASLAMAGQLAESYGEDLVAIIFLHASEQDTTADDQQVLQAFTLGGFSITTAGRSIDTRHWKRSQSLTLLKYLITQLDRQVHFERLIDCLWPEVDQAQGRGRLKVVMYDLRRELRSSGLGDMAIKTVGSAYLLRRDSIWVDSIAFEKFVAAGRVAQREGLWDKALACYDDAVGLYRGEYMEEEPYSDWCAEERERLHELYLEALARSAECLAEVGRLADAVDRCRRALAIEPCREHLHYLLMDYLDRNGHPDLALIQYRRCAQIMMHEFGAEPMPRTARLRKRILDAMEATPIHLE